MNQARVALTCVMLYLAGIATIRLLETNRVELGAIVYAIAMGMCSMMVLMTEEK